MKTLSIRLKVTLSSLALCIMLSACERNTTIRAICDNQPHFCEDLNQDGWCRSEKAKVIRARLAFSETPEDEQRYHLLSSFHSYKECIEKVAFIEYKKKKERTTTRVQALLTATNEIERISKETQDSNNPYLLLYHWTYNSDQEAGKQLLSQEGSKELDNPTILQALAYHYSKLDIKYSIKLLKRAVALSKTSYPDNIFDSIATMHLQSKDFESAYIWSLIAKAMGNKNVDETMIERYQQFTEAQVDKLKERAEQILDDIEDFNFRFPPAMRRAR